MRIAKNLKHGRFISLYLTLVFLLCVFGYIVIGNDTFSKIFNFKYVRYPLSLPKQHDPVTERIKPIKEPTCSVKANSSIHFDTLKGIQDFIWNRLNDFQDFGNCENKLLLYCESKYPFNGLGSMLFRFGACLQISFALGRTMFLIQREYQHFGGLNKWLKLESKTCGYLKEKYRNYANKCNLKDRKCYLNDNVLEVNNSYKVFEIDMTYVFPVPRYIPSTIPCFIEHALEKLKVKTPWLWFSSQFLGYMMLRPNDEFQKTLEKIKSGISFNNIALSLHVRRGDKIRTHEAEFIPDEKYIDAIQNLYDHQNIPKSNNTKIIYVASDDSLSGMKKIWPSNFIMKRPPPKYLSEGLQSYATPNFSSTVLESILIDVNLLSHTNFTICTMSSNICRLAHLLKNAIPPYNAKNRVISLDWQDYFERYFWAGYNVPLTDFYITIKRKDNINLHINGASILLSYEKGFLYQLAEPKISIPYGDSYVNMMKPIHQSSDATCYILFDDVMEWPGNPEYPAFQ